MTTSNSTCVPVAGHSVAITKMPPSPRCNSEPDNVFSGKATGRLKGKFLRSLATAWFMLFRVEECTVPTTSSGDKWAKVHKSRNHRPTLESEMPVFVPVRLEVRFVCSQSYSVGGQIAYGATGENGPKIGPISSHVLRTFFLP
jgi:hypothetical protein